MTPLVQQSAGQLSVDSEWFRQVNDFARATPWLHAPIHAYAQYGVVLFALVMLWAWWAARRRGDLAAVSAALWAPVGTLVALGLAQPIVNSVREPRPYTSLTHVLVLGSRSADYSFPSDHAVMAGAVAAGVFMASRKLGLLAFVAALVMGFARVYVGAHFPGDVAAGLLFGGVVTVAARFLLGWLVTFLVVRLARTRLSFLVTAAPAPERPLEMASSR